MCERFWIICIKLCKWLGWGCRRVWVGGSSREGGLGCEILRVVWG